MRNLYFYAIKKGMATVVVLGVFILCLTSCGSKRMLISRAVNTINTAHLDELNLTKGDYEIFNTITAEAQIVCQYKSRGNTIVIEGENGEFRLTYKKEKGSWVCEHVGIMKLGFFGRDYEVQDDGLIQPEVIVRRLAIYRAINTAKEYGADSMIEPTISTNVEQIGDKVYYKSTVTTKLLKLKTN